MDLSEHFRLTSYAVNYITQLLLPDGYDTTTYEAEVNTLDKVTKLYNEEGRIVVWSGGSDNTIYDCPKTNHNFRAWHDFLHVTMGATFTEAGERNVCNKHIRQTALYLSHKFNKAQFNAVAVTLDAEINGQVQYLLQHGQFVDNQREFMEQYLMNKL
jgi:hypothetical protein